MESGLNGRVYGSEKMKCGHEVYKCFFEVTNNVVKIKYVCKEGHETELTRVGKVPLPEDLEIRD